MEKALDQWILEFVALKSSFIEPVMGWTGGGDTLASEVKLYFNSKEEAINYVINHEIEHEVIKQKLIKQIIKLISIILLKHNTEDIKHR